MTLEDPQAESSIQGLGRWRWCVALLIAVGAALRIWRAGFAGLPMRIDEIRVAVNLQARSYAELALPLDHQQGAPVGFLWLCKLAVQVLGDHDFAYRVVPMLAGVGVVVLVPLLARRIVGRAGVVLATGFAALAPWAIQYSSDLKQYSMDALATAGVLLAALHALDPKATWRSRAALAAVGSLAIVGSHAAMFVTAAAGLTLGLAALRCKRWRSVVELLGVALVWAGTFAVLWLINLRHISGRGDLMDFWAQDFMPLPPTTAAQWGWYARAPMEWINTSGFYFNPIVLLFVGLGLWSLRRRLAVAGLLLGPVAVTLAASAAKQYPFANRMIAFLMPATVLLLAVGFDQAVRWGRRRGPKEKGVGYLFPDNEKKVSDTFLPAFLPEALAVVLALLCFFTTLPYSQLNRPWMGGRFDLVRPMQDIKQDHRAGDLIVMGNALWWPYINWYAPQMDLPYEYDTHRFVNQRMPRDPADEYADQLRVRLADAARAAADDGTPHRVWVLAADGIWMGHHPKWPTLGDMHDTRAPTHQVLEQLGTIEQQHDYANVSLYLWVPDDAAPELDLP